ncbi:NAD(P)H-hydrate dehydratase [Sphingobium sp.]|uniref:NAD(P)H-hydrate dehydratase n=1 Tax=Sphingobium sp. TaxID=1912891 RepID=UPI0028BF3F51|nr:NAD(P)H-hydrate dehydratase [Sphingobium sp.]
MSDIILERFPSDRHRSLVRKSRKAKKSERRSDAIRSETALDAAWLRAHPLPPVDDASDKDRRGRVLVAGGAEFVPGALRLTGEAALRAGAGRLQMATVRSAAMSLGVLVPEAAMIALPAQEDGEIAASAAALLIERARRCDMLIMGPGMSVSAGTDELVATVLDALEAPLTVLLDAAALTSARALQPIIARHEGRVILTPHHGEMAILADMPPEAVAADPQGVARAMATEFQAVVLLKGRRSIICDPAGQCLLYEGSCAGLATGGSGDVLAGVVGGLAARGAAPRDAAAWATWVHGQAGQRLQDEVGGVGFLARDLLPLIPRILNGISPTGQDQDHRG